MADRAVGLAVDLDREVGALAQADRQIAVEHRLADRGTEVGGGREADHLAVGDDRLAALLLAEVSVIGDSLLPLATRRP